LSSGVFSFDERLAWLRLARTDSVGPVTFAHLLGRFGAASAALKALPEIARRGGRTEPPRIPTLLKARNEIDAGEALGARLLISGEQAFPFPLASLDPPPPVLWAWGDTALLTRPMVAVVGARIASAAGRRMARDLAVGLGEAGWVVVSGMARGIDAAAHEGAMATGSVAVLAGGVDDIYPPEHADLHKALTRQGCVVSERPIGAKAKAADFPRRNRIISGLSRGVVVVEAELRSGSLITARLAAEQGREVFAVPGSPLDPRARGANDLLRQGACLVEESADILRVLDALPGLAAPPSPKFEISHNARPADSPDAVTLIQALLSPSPVSIDDLARESGAPMAQVLAALTDLALAGRAELLPGALVIGTGAALPDERWPAL
jgi:DNA processing protein